MWGLIAAELALFAGGYAYHRWLAPKPPKALQWGVQVPQVAEGSAVPLIYGSCRVRAPVLAWAGGQRQAELHDQIAFFVDMLYVVGLPFYGGGATLTSIYAGDRIFFVEPSSTYRFGPFPLWGDPNATGRSNYWVHTNTRVANDDLQIPTNFAFVEFWSGHPDQSLTDFIVDVDYSLPEGALSDTQGVLEVAPTNFLYEFLNDDADGTFTLDPLPPQVPPTDIPSFRHFAVACMYRWCNGAGTSVPAYSFDVTSLSVGTSSFLGQSDNIDADPAAVILDLITAPFGKLGLPMSRVDVPSFQEASLALYNEGHGYSRAIDQSEEASAIIADILRQIDGVLYEEPTTGRLVLKLARYDYDVLTLPDINPDNASPAGASWYQIQGWSETLNQVRVTFTDRQNAYADGVVIGQNLANAVMQGNRLRSLDVHFPGCCTRTLAQKLASRELAVVSRPMVRASVVVNRAFYATRIGDVVTLTWPELGISKMVMRVARVDLGQLHAGDITLDLVRDVFDVSRGAFPSP